MPQPDMPPAADAETAALHAVRRGDPDTARRIIAAMHPAQRATLAHHLVRLRTLLAERTVPRTRTPHPDSQGPHPS